MRGNGKRTCGILRHVRHIHKKMLFTNIGFSYRSACPIFNSDAGLPDCHETIAPPNYPRLHQFFSPDENFLDALL
jgi:hypothetical protein